MKFTTIIPINNRRQNLIDFLDILDYKNDLYDTYPENDYIFTEENRKSAILWCERCYMDTILLAFYNHNDGKYRTLRLLGVNEDEFGDSFKNDKLIPFELVWTKFQVFKIE